MKDIYIFSAGPGGRDLYQLINDINKIKKTWNVLAYIDNDEKLQQHRIDGLKVLKPENLDCQDNQSSYGVCGILDPHLRMKIINNEIVAKGINIPSLIHPKSVIASDFIPNDGLIVFSGVNISYNVKIDRYVLISFGSLVGHDCSIGKYSSLLPASIMDGQCKLGESSILGSGAMLHPGVTVGSNSIVGMGTVVLDDVEDEITVTQMPRMIKLKNK